MGQRSATSLGLIFTVIAAASFGVITSLAALTYQGGGSPTGLVISRYIFGSLAVGLLALALRRSFRIDRAAILPMVGVTLGTVALGAGYLSSVFFIPVSLAAMIFYTYPMMVAAIAPFTEGTPIRRDLAIGFPIAFLGIVLALGPPFYSLDWRGVALALTGAAGATTIFIASARVLDRVDSLVLAFYTNLAGLPLIAVILLSLGSFVLPQTATGWAGFTGANLFFVCAIATMFIAIRLAGPTRTALWFNLEPLVSILAAAVLLGERLATIQYVGGACVLTALLIASQSKEQRETGETGPTAP
ncbi:MAG: DMT family transporter [Minwuiales bacterium]|nr:DMT family transporter [Minwuiales bacterium]